MKMMFHIDDFKCTLCTNWFCPPFNLPYLLPCTHSICTSCLQKSSNNDHIICPEDLQSCPIHSININLTTKKALQRLMKQHKNYNQNTQLQCIKSLSICFDQILLNKQKQLRNLQALIDQIFQSQIQRLKYLHSKIKIDINRPYRIVQDWKQIVMTHLTNIRKLHNNNSHHDIRSNSMLQINHYIQQGRKIKMELNQFFQLDFDLFADRVMRYPRICFQKDFGINTETLVNRLKIRNIGESNDSKINIITDKKQRNNKNYSTIQQRNKTQKLQTVGNATILLSAQNRKDKSYRDSTRPLTNIDMNTVNSQHQGFETKRGNNKQKIDNKIIEAQNNSSVHLDKYILKQNVKNSGQPLRRDSKLKNSNLLLNQAASPCKYNKQMENKASVLRNSIKKDSRCSLTSQLENKNCQFSLSQFQLQRLTDGNQSMLKQKSRLAKHTSPRNSKIKQITQKSPALSIENFEQDKMHKLAHMLQNISAQTSLRNSLKKSRNKQQKKSSINQNSLDNSLLMSPNTIREQYTQQAGSQVPYQQQQLLNNDENDHGNGWQLGNINFLKQWKLKNENIVEQPLQIRQNTYYYNCEKQKLSYMRKMQIHKVQQTLKLTLIKDNYIQLINQSLHDVDMALYLQQFDWKHYNIEIVKFVKTALNDEQLNILLNFLVKSSVKALVLSGNNLTDVCLDAFLNFVTMNNVLKNVYLPKNYINILKSKAKINLLKDKGLNIYI